MKQIKGKIVDIFKKEIYTGTITIKNGKIFKIIKCSDIKDCDKSAPYIMPGFIDSHVHIESSMLTPSAFGKIAATHGTIAIVSDPHEIANVAGINGITYMLNESKKSPVKIYFTIPSCVPATSFESCNAPITAEEVEKLFASGNFVGLSEMMNYVGVINGDRECIAKIHAAQHHHKPVDGHIPDLSGKELQKYISAGISTDHETYKLVNGLEKINAGMMLQLREGSSAKNFEELLPLLKKHPDKIMFCSDDLKCSDLMHGHINLIVAKAISLGYDLFDVLRAATLNPSQHYNLNIGMLQEGDSADFIVCSNLTDFIPDMVFITGERVDNIKEEPVAPFYNTIFSSPLTPSTIETKEAETTCAHIIEIVNNQLITKNITGIPEKDSAIQKLIVLNRYSPNSSPAKGFIKGFGLHKGAIAMSISHDSHNLIATGSSDDLICKAINEVIKAGGGICAVTERRTAVLPLQIAGLMSSLPINEVIDKYDDINLIIKDMGCKLSSPLITLSFMALPVIPELRLTCNGLFDVKNFKLIPLPAE